MQEKVRLNKYIASTGITSRRGADELIKAGRVKVNGNIVKEPGISVAPNDFILIDNKKIKVREKKYVIFYKPAGYITAKSDPQERKTIYDLLPQEIQHLKPAGRLDKDSSGLLILSNDGDLIQRLTHPREHVPKVYRVIIEGKVNTQDIYDLQKGIKIEDEKIAYADTLVLEVNKEKSTLQVTLYQGYNRQIRKMMDAINHPVIALKRIMQANISLKGLEKGKHRYLSGKEVRELFNYLNKVKRKKYSKKPTIK